MSNDGSGIIWLSTVGGVLTLLGFWTKFVTDRISGAKGAADKADTKADAASQEAAEAKNEIRDVRELLEEIIRDIHDKTTRASREMGESHVALRQKLTDVELFIRDNFARKDELVAAVMRIEAGQIRTDTKIEAGQVRTDTKFDELRDLIKSE